MSKDSVASHRRFKAAHALPFILLADEERQLCEAFGVLVEKTMYGKKTIGVARSTFLIGAQGVLRAVWPKVTVEGHAADVLAKAGAALT
ncbi:redoxin domain-containing protein [bacterium]|nr:MAG: redoxin domain-containing protein [bacterium]